MLFISRVVLELDSEVEQALHKTEHYFWEINEKFVHTYSACLAICSGHIHVSLSGILRSNGRDK